MRATNGGDRMSRYRLLSLFILLAFAAPSLGHGAPQTPREALRAPWSKVEKGSNVLPGVRLREAIASKKQTLEQILELQRAVLTAPKDRGGSAMRGVPLTANAIGDDTRSFPVGSADFNADGKDEVLTIDSDLAGSSLTFDYPAQLSVRSGSDGSV